MFSLLVQLIGILPGLEGLQPYLLSTQFNAWQGLLRSPIDWAPIVRAAWVCALYGVPALIAAGLVFLRRDVAGRLRPMAERVLIVEDDAPVRRMLERSLGAEGFEVRSAPDGGARPGDGGGARRPTSSCSTWRCRASAASTSAGGCARRASAVAS